MRPIIIVMLAVQAASFLVAAWYVMFKRTTGDDRRPVWTSVTLMLVIVSGASWSIASGRAGEPGADILLYNAPLLLGMALMSAFVMIRQRRGLHRP